MERLIAIIDAKINKLEADMATFISEYPNYKMDREDLATVTQYAAQIDTYESVLSMLMDEKTRIEKLYDDKKTGLDKCLESWNKAWDGVVGDLSAREYYAIKSEQSLLAEIFTSIIRSDQNNPLIVQEDL